MSKFVRDMGRYVVLKMSDVHEYLTGREYAHLRSSMARVNAGRKNDGKKLKDFVCISSTCPYYDEAWKLVEKWVADVAAAATGTLNAPQGSYTVGGSTFRNGYAVVDGMINGKHTIPPNWIKPTEPKVGAKTDADIVEDWLYGEPYTLEDEEEAAHNPPTESIAAIIDQARQADKNAKLVYQIMGWLIADLTVSHNLVVTPANFDQILFRAKREFEMPHIETHSEEAEVAVGIILPPSKIQH